MRVRQVLRPQGSDDPKNSALKGRKSAMRFVMLFLLAAFGSFAAIPAHAQLRVAVEGAGFKPIRIAVPDFDASGNGAAEAASQLGQVIRADLQGSAVFEIVDKNA